MQSNEVRNTLHFFSFLSVDVQLELVKMSNRFLSPCPVLSYTVNTISCPCFTQAVSSLPLQSYLTQSTQFHVLVLHRLFPLSLSNPILHGQHNFMSLFYTDCFLSPSPILFDTVNTISCPCFTQTVSSLPLQSYFTVNTTFGPCFAHLTVPTQNP